MVESMMGVLPIRTSSSKLVRLRARHRPLVAGRVGELVAVARREVVQDGWAAGTCRFNISMLVLCYRE